MIKKSREINYLLSSSTSQSWILHGDSLSVCERRLFLQFIRSTVIEIKKKEQRTKKSIQLNEWIEHKVFFYIQLKWQKSRNSTWTLRTIFFLSMLHNSIVNSQSKLFSFHKVIEKQWTICSCDVDVVKEFMGDFPKMEHVRRLANRHPD